MAWIFGVHSEISEAIASNRSQEPGFNAKHHVMLW
jgi:hypothetical protein